ncbi:MAG: hypothetical protein U0Q03_21705 [Acidimicrobiales bacterium]
MARSLAHFVVDPEAAVATASRRRLDRATVRALASALAALAIATVVVTESTSALHPEGTASSNDLQAGTITLVDDDEGRSLVDLPAMAPGRPVERCITITYAGSVLPARMSLSAELTGDIGDFVSVHVERGSSGGFESCDGFESAEVLHDGTLAGFADQPFEVGTFRQEGETTTFRFVFDLVDDAAAQGRSGTVGFVWEATPA